MNSPPSKAHLRVVGGKPDVVHEPIDPLIMADMAKALKEMAAEGREVRRLQALGLLPPDTPPPPFEERVAAHFVRSLMIGEAREATEEKLGRELFRDECEYYAGIHCGDADAFDKAFRVRMVALPPNFAARLNAATCEEALPVF
jgi:hypothetical protein